MTKSKNTKKALLASIISMLMCFTMLIGSTFAWFTDTETTNVNEIKSGTLDIQLLAAANEMAENLEGKKLQFVKAAGHEDEAILFEPGAKYKLQQAWLYNAGDLHAKYQVVISGIDGNEKLAQVLDVYVNETYVGTLMDLATNANGVIKTNTIAPKTFDTFGTIELKMQESADNNYQGLTIDGIAITVYATQATVEYDSYNNTYDEYADINIPVINVGSQTELTEEIENNTQATVVLSKGEYTLPPTSNKEITVTGTKDAVIDMSSAVNASDSTFTFDGVTVKFDNDNYEGLQHSEKVVYKNCTINGKQFMYSDAEFINCTFVNYDDYCIWTYGAENVTFTDCTFDTGGKAILVYNEQSDYTGNITFNNCTFKDNGTLNTVKAAVETGVVSGSHNVYNITFTDCTVNGFAVNDEGISTGSTLWGNKNSMTTDNLNVVINGVDVY